MVGLVEAMEAAENQGTCTWEVSKERARPGGAKRTKRV